MPLIPTADDLRTLNLAYQHLQRDVRRFQPELFRSNESLTTDASGYLYLPTYVLEVEDIRNAQNEKLPRIDIEEKYSGNGYYHDGMSTTGATDGKRRLMVRSAGAAKTLTAYTVHYLREYSNMASVSAKPYPFTGATYLDMLTTLQAYYWLMEQGAERKDEKEERFREYRRLLEMLGMDQLDDEAEYGITSHADAGDRRTYPVLNGSSS